MIAPVCGETNNPCLLFQKMYHLADKVLLQMFAEEQIIGLEKKKYPSESYADMVICGPRMPDDEELGVRRGCLWGGIPSPAGMRRPVVGTLCVLLILLHSSNANFITIKHNYP